MEDQVQNVKKVMEIYGMLEKVLFCRFISYFPIQYTSQIILLGLFVFYVIHTRQCVSNRVITIMLYYNRN